MYIYITLSRPLHPTPPFYLSAPFYICCPLFYLRETLVSFPPTPLCANRFGDCPTSETTPWSARPLTRAVAAAGVSSAAPARERR